MTVSWANGTRDPVPAGSPRHLRGSGDRGYDRRDPHPPDPHPPVIQASVGSGGLDAATKYLAVMELKQTPPCPFDGRAHEYHGWVKSINVKMDRLQLSSIDKIEILEAQTCGGPRDVIKTFRNAYGAFPDTAIKIIYEKLEKRFGSDLEVATQLRAKLNELPEIRGSQTHINVALQLRKMSDLFITVAAHMDLVPDLQTLNYAEGIKTLRTKLPEFLNNKWRSSKRIYKKHYNCHPNFGYFCDFIEEKTDELCDDLIPEMSGTISKDDSNQKAKPSSGSGGPRILQTSVTEPSVNLNKCPLHKSDSHSLPECSAFVQLDTGTKRLIIRNNDLCYRCLGSHIASECEADIECDVCKATNHMTVMHFTRRDTRPGKFSNSKKTY